MFKCRSASFIVALLLLINCLMPVPIKAVRSSISHISLENINLQEVVGIVNKEMALAQRKRVVF